MAALFLFTIVFVLAVQQTVIAEDSVSADDAVSEEDLQYVGCYPLAVLGTRVNVTRLKVDSCMLLCRKWGNAYAAYKNTQLCHCLKNLTYNLKPVDDLQCPYRCEKFEGKTCGGLFAASMYATVPTVKESPWYARPWVVVMLVVLAAVILLIIGHVTLLAWRNGRRVMVITD